MMDIWPRVARWVDDLQHILANKLDNAGENYHLWMTKVAKVLLVNMMVCIRSTSLYQLISIHGKGLGLAVK
jgi:hypothetical protein